LAGYLCIVMRTASLRPVTLLPQICTVWCTKLQKHFNAPMKCFTVSPLQSACLALHQTIMKTKGRQLQRACKRRWLSSEATVRAWSEILAVWPALKQLSENDNDARCVVLLQLMKTKISAWCFGLVNIATSPDKNEQSFSGGMFQLCTDESFRKTMHQ